MTIKRKRVTVDDFGAEMPASNHQHRPGGIIMSRRELLTVPEFCKEWRVARSTFYAWLAKGTAPRVVKLPNGQLRIDRREVETWASAHELGAA
jgi:predicted DNA-binding transcriptional regulator AlpA